VSLIGSGAALSIAMVVVIAIAAGHWLGGPDPDERSTLALASAMRHPGIAMAIASLNVPQEPRVPAAVILYLLTALSPQHNPGRARRSVGVQSQREPRP
jgi:BASS family bile acid:Na+ symporter